MPRPTHPKVHGPTRGVFYFVFVILDLFSHYVVGWLAAETENAALVSMERPAPIAG